MSHNFWLAKPYGLANQKLCYIQIYKILEKKTTNVFESDWGKQTLNQTDYICRHQIKDGWIGRICL